MEILLLADILLMMGRLLIRGNRRIGAPLMKLEMWVKQHCWRSNRKDLRNGPKDLRSLLDTLVDGIACVA